MRALAWIFGFFGILAMLAATVAWFVLKPTGFDWVAMLGLGGLAGVIFFLGTYSDQIRALGDEQSTSRMIVSFVAVCFAFGIAVFANVVAHRFDARWDATESKTYTLSDQTVKILSELDRDVEVHAFFTSLGPEGGNFHELMDRYEEKTSLLKVEFHDPYADPVLTQKYNVLSDRGTVILQVGDKQQRLESDFGEEAFTNALVRVTSDKEHSVCAVTGHGEADPEDTYSPTGLGFLKTKIEGQNYKFTTLNLLEKQPTTDTCEVVLLASPRTDLLAAELDRLAAYVAGGGHLFVMLDPFTAEGTAADMARYGINVGKDLVIETDPYRVVGQGDPTRFALDQSSYDISPITGNLRGISVIAMARSVRKGAEIAGLNVQELAFASPESWGETGIDMNSTEPPVISPDTETKGKTPLLVSVEVTDPAAVRTKTEAAAPAAPAAPGAPAIAALAAATPAVAATDAPPAKAGGKVVVIGDGDFAMNMLVSQAETNKDLALNVIAWMVDEKDQLAIRANDAASGKLELGLLSVLLSGFVSLLVVPGTTIAVGIGNWLRRRRM